MSEKINLNLIAFIALMGTSTLALVTKSIFDNFFANIFSYLLEIFIIIIFCYYFYKFIVYLLKRVNLEESLKDPMKSNLYSAVPIASALISIMLIKIGLPYFDQGDIIFSIIFWIASLIFSLAFIILVPINLKFRCLPEQIFGTWFLPPVGLFVFITAGSILGLEVPSLAMVIILFNIFLLGPAFILYFLTLNLVYSRSIFYEVKAKKMIPAFNIVLAPVGVSILAMLTTSKLLSEYNFLEIDNLFLGISEMYSLIMFGYGLWVLFGLSYFYYLKSAKEKEVIPFSEIWWTFIFPLGAFALSSINLYSVTNIYFIKIIYLILYFILLVLWFYVFLRQMSLNFSKKQQDK